MNQLIMILCFIGITASATLGAGLKLEVNALPTSEEIQTATTHANHVGSISEMASLVIRSCTTQMGTDGGTVFGDCAKFMEIFDKYMTQAVSEAGPQINKILGFSVGQ